MARPIEPTPVLKGEDMFNFVKAMEEVANMPREEKKRLREEVEEHAKIFQSWLTFNF